MSSRPSSWWAKLSEWTTSHAVTSGVRAGSDTFQTMSSCVITSARHIYGAVVVGSDRFPVGVEVELSDEVRAVISEMPGFEVRPVAANTFTNANPTGGTE